MTPDEMLEHARRIAGGGKAMNKDQQQAFMLALLPALEGAPPQGPAEPPATPIDKGEAVGPSPENPDELEAAMVGPCPATVNVTDSGSITVDNVPPLIAPREARGFAVALMRAAFYAEQQANRPQTNEET